MSRVGKTQHVYLGAKPAFHLSAHTNAVSCIDWVPPRLASKGNKPKYQLCSVGTSDHLLQLMTVNAGNSVTITDKWILPSKSNEILVDSIDGHFVLVGDVNGQIHQIKWT